MIILVICNCRDEIQRIKAGNPDITHREAFSAAAKNVKSLSSPASCIVVQPSGVAAPSRCSHVVLI
jgi:hypothetical protein